MSKKDFVLDWRRLEKGLSDSARYNGGGDPVQAVGLVRAIVERSGPSSQNIKMARRIGLLCLHGKPNVIVPVCPDLPHNGQVYIFQGGLGTGMSLLAHRQLDFLEGMQDLLGSITLLYADRESLDPLLQRICQVDQVMFMERLRGSVEATKQLVAERGLKVGVAMMSEVLPGLGDHEEEMIQHLLATEATELGFMTTARSDMYRRMGCWNRQEQVLRTARTTAQYIALGHLATKQNLAVVNHTTVNLVRYIETGTALIHNPVKVY